MVTAADCWGDSASGRQWWTDGTATLALARTYTRGVRPSTAADRRPAPAEWTVQDSWDHIIAAEATRGRAVSPQQRRLDMLLLDNLNRRGISLGRTDIPSDEDAETPYDAEQVGDLADEAGPPDNGAPQREDGMNGGEAMTLEGTTGEDGGTLGVPEELELCGLTAGGLGGLGELDGGLTQAELNGEIPANLDAAAEPGEEGGIHTAGLTRDGGDGDETDGGTSEEGS